MPVQLIPTDSTPWPHSIPDVEVLSVHLKADKKKGKSKLRIASKTGEDKLKVIKLEEPDRPTAYGNCGGISSGKCR